MVGSSYNDILSPVVMSQSARGKPFACSLWRSLYGLSPSLFGAVWQRLFLAGRGHVTSASRSVEIGRRPNATKIGVFGRDWSTPSHRQAPHVIASGCAKDTCHRTFKISAQLRVNIMTHERLYQPPPAKMTQLGGIVSSKSASETVKLTSPFRQHGRTF